MSSIIPDLASQVPDVLLPLLCMTFKFSSSKLWAHAGLGEVEVWAASHPALLAKRGVLSGPLLAESAAPEAAGVNMQVLHQVSVLHVLQARKGEFAMLCCGW